ncbi:unnamed protein product [Sphagnum balticum]
MGRVITLIREPASRVYGIAYEIKRENAEKTFEYLNYREKCGYTMHKVQFYASFNLSKDQPHDAAEAGTSLLDAICYFANEDNFYFSKEPDLVKQAQLIAQAVGPSGSNREYLFNFCQALKSLLVGKLNELENGNDKHIFELENLVRSINNS